MAGATGVAVGSGLAASAAPVDSASAAAVVRKNLCMAILLPRSTRTSCGAPKQMWQRFVLVTCHVDRACTNGMSQCNPLRHTISAERQKGSIFVSFPLKRRSGAPGSRYIHRAARPLERCPRTAKGAAYSSPQSRPDSHLRTSSRYDLRRQDLARSGLPPAAYGNRDDALLGNAERYEPSTVMRRNPTGTIRRKPCENARPVLRSELKLRAQRHQARLTQQGPSRAGVRVGHALCQCTRCAPCITKLAVRSTDDLERGPRSLP